MQDPRISRLEVRVRFGETDLMGIVHHATYLYYFELGRVEWLRSRGAVYRDWAERGMHLPVVDAHLRYHRPARFDDLLQLETKLCEVRSCSLAYAYRLQRDGDLLTEGTTRLACVDAQGVVNRLPDDFRAVLARSEIREALENAQESSPANRI